MSAQIDHKRTEATKRIIQNTLGTTVSGAVPLAKLDFARELSIAAADAWMLYEIYTVYFEHSPTTKQIFAVFGDDAALLLASGVGGYVAAKIGHSILSQTLDKIPVAGWLLNGTIAGLTSYTLGMVWLTLVETAYRQQQPAAQYQPLPTDDAQPVTAAPQIDITDQTITTKRPDGKPGAEIPAENYELVRKAMIDMLRGRDPIPLQEVIEAIDQNAGEKLDKSARWYVNTVKFDLEARGIVERVPNQSPQYLRLLEG